MSEDNSIQQKSITVNQNWIEIVEDKFTCSECENTSIPETNTEEGTVNADLKTILKDLEQFPTKVIYGICPVCGMEYQFKKIDNKLFLEPSEMEK